MTEPLPFFNFSLKKVLAREPDSLKRAKIQIILTALVFTIIKALLVIFVAFQYGQYLQAFRAGVIVISFFVLIKILLYRPASVAVLSHIIILTGLLMIWSNLLFVVHHINIVTIQMIFMITLVGYYLIGGIRAACYTVLAIMPVLYCILVGNGGIAAGSSQELVSAGADPLIVLNFVTFVITHYLYYRAFKQNLKEKEALNVQLQINIAEVKALAESRSVFLSTMSHELRTPLNGVIGMAHLLRDTAVEEQLDTLNILEFSANNLLSVINDVLDYNKSELDKIELEPLPVNLAVLMGKIHSGLGNKATEKGLELVLDIDDRLKKIMVLTDPTRITQIIYNLAGNAIKFTDEGTVKISLQVKRIESDKASVYFSISDTGIGIASERQEAIFDPFTQASSDTTRKFGGTGLGLAIVKRLLKLFNSTIYLDSQSGTGAIFYFSIDFQLCSEEIQTGRDPQSDTNDLKGLKLLIAEDNRINVMLLEKLLSKWEISTVVAWNGQEAIDKLLLENFDGILMDIHMPVMDGYNAARAIRELSDPDKANIPIIAITASVSHQLYAKITLAGMQDYIHKPFQPNQLCEKLNQVLKNRALQGA
jgi:signal transduction histidine kinase/ActR/RegA family two-component response regulator